MQASVRTEVHRIALEFLALLLPVTGLNNSPFVHWPGYHSPVLQATASRSANIRRISQVKPVHLIISIFGIFQ